MYCCAVHTLVGVLSITGCCFDEDGNHSEICAIPGEFVKQGDMQEWFKNLQKMEWKSSFKNISLDL